MQDYEQWLKTHFQNVCSSPLAERHHRLWRWFQSLKTGEMVPAQIEVWPRGGAKSSTADLGCAFLNHQKKEVKRHFVLYVCGTQEQAELHVQAIATLFEKLKVKRLLGKYNTSKGWRQDQLRTTTDFNVAAYGLDGASRGVKLDQYRPDRHYLRQRRQRLCQRSLQRHVGAV